MTRLRAFLLVRGPAALLLLVFAFAVRALVPQGYMVAPEASFALIPCPQTSGAAPTAMTSHHGGMDHSMHMPARHDGGDHRGSEKAGDGVCAFAPLSQGATAGADPVLLIAALALVFATALIRPTPTPALRRRAWLQPPLRGPPAAA